VWFSGWELKRWWMVCVCEGYEWIGVESLDDGGLVLFLDDGMWFG